MAEARFPGLKTGIDRDMFHLIDGSRKGYLACIREEVEPKEAEIERLRALVQVLVDGLHAVATLADVDTDDRGTIARDPLTAAKQAGFVPTNTEDNG